MEGFGELVRTIFIAVMVVVAIIAIGFNVGYHVGYDKGVTDCNNKTIKEQLGL